MSPHPIPFPLPLPGYKLPPDTQLPPIEKSVYQQWAGETPALFIAVESACPPTLEHELDGERGQNDPEQPADDVDTRRADHAQQNRRTAHAEPRDGSATA